MAEAANGRPEINLIATGSEVSLIVEASVSWKSKPFSRLVSIRAGSCSMRKRRISPLRVSASDPPAALVEAGATQGWLAMSATSAT